MRMRTAASGSTLMLLMVLPAISWLGGTAGSTFAQPPEDSLDRDYSEELPRIAPLEPGEAGASFHVAPGYRLEQVAAEPIVVDPIAMAFDEYGRLYVVEMRGYSEDDQAMLGRIRLLEDVNGDGFFDRSTVFADDLSWPTALACYDGGLFVGAAPDILYLRDGDGDGTADEREVVCTGFGRSNVQGLMNTFLWGLDNRIHGATSSSGAEVRAGEDGPVELTLRGRDFAFDPRTRELAATSGGGQHGMSFNDWGDKFVCSNSNHIQYVVYDDHYIGRNPFFAAPPPRITIATDGPQADVFRRSPVEPWRIVRTRLRRQGLVPGPVERGGLAAGYFTGATGVTLFRGTAWPDDGTTWAVIGDVGSNLVHRKRLSADGVVYRADRTDTESELLASTDIWFRPVQFANGPDGALYIADMYREVIEHPKSLPPLIKRHLDLTSGRDRGRIYRLVRDDFRPELPVRLGDAGIEGLAAALEHANGWHRDTAARLLWTRRDPAAVPHLLRIAQQSRSPEARVRALYLLDALAPELRADWLTPVLDDEHPRVRAHAMKLAEALLEVDPAFREEVLARFDSDATAHEHLQWAFSLGEFQDPRRLDLLVAIARRRPDDAWIRAAIQSSLVRDAGTVLERLARDERFRGTGGGRALLTSLARQVARQRDESQVTALMSALAYLADHDPTVAAGLFQGIELPADHPLHDRLAAAAGGEVEALLGRMLAEAAATARDRNADVERRVAAIGQLRLARSAEHRAVFQSLLEPSQPEAVQHAALDTLAVLAEMQVSDLLLSQWSEMTPRVREHAANVLFSRAEHLLDLLDAIEQDRVPARDLDPQRRTVLTMHPDPRVRTRARSLLAELLDSARSAVVDDYRNVLEQPGDVERGRMVFRRVCAACHRLEDTGHELGPQLASAVERGDEFVLLNVLDPNREVNPQYLNYTAVTVDGRLFTGMIAAETANSITLVRGENARDTLLRVDIDSMTSTGMSLMPEGLEQEIDHQAMADLMAYLKETARGSMSR